MIVLRFKATARPDRADDLAAALSAVVAPSLALDGVVSFDVGRDVTDPNSFVALEIFENEAAMKAQDALSETEAAKALMPETLAGPPEVAMYEVSG